ncbi:hypothetical protein ACIBEA_27585 [Streptomyces sp. NPDC051555]|uniref:hypothetical protein n=1 Tax=Streptomyces sp. NPDC051555 TaxID=3365657 RepID=UPI003788306F
MANTPEVTVGPPDDLGWRKVTIDHKPAGKVRSPGELQRFLRHGGLEFGQPVHWIGGDSTVWPDRAVQRRTVGSLMFIGFLLTACLLIRVGWTDGGNALTFGERLAGYTVLTAGLVELIAAVATLDYWHKRRRHYSGVAVLAGVAIVFIASSSLLLLQIGEGFSGWTTIGICFLAGSVVAGIELIRSRVWKGFPNPRSVAIGAIIPTLLAGVNLAYSQVYVPYVTTPLIVSGAEFKEASMDSARAAMEATLHVYVKNDGNIPVYVLGSIYWIRGGPANNLSKSVFSYTSIYDGEFVIPAGRELNPGEEISQDVVVEIKDPEKANYEVIGAQTEVYVIRRDRMTLPPEYGKHRVEVKEFKKEGERAAAVPDDAEYVNDSRISNSSEILNITRGRQRITSWRIPGNLARVDVAITPPGDTIVFDPQRLDFSKRILDRYGFSEVRGSTDWTPYKGLLEKARSTKGGSAPEQTPGQTPGQSSP